MAAPSIGRAARQAGIDLYFNSWRFVPANLAWGLALLGVLFAAVLWPPAVALAILLAIPIAGIHRMAALVARDEPASLSDFFEGMRRFGRQAIGITAAAAILGAVLLTNVATGFASDGPLAWFVGATAMYGLAALAMYLVAIWPVLVDPAREGASFRRHLQLAALVVIGKPGRLFVLTMLIVATLLTSAVIVGAIVLVGVAYASLVATRWVLPALDELEARYEAARAR